MLDVKGDDITVNPVGKQAVLICQADDLLSGNGEPQSESFAAGFNTLKTPAKVVPEPKPSDQASRLLVGGVGRSHAVEAEQQRDLSYTCRAAAFIEGFVPALAWLSSR